MKEIHPSAIIHPQAELAEGVAIGPGVVLGPEVQIGTGTKIGPHTVIEGRVIIGQRNEIGPFVCIGHAPQHLLYKGEPTSVEIGDENVIREYVSIHRGTLLDQGVTRIGNRCYLMAYAHVGHDCDLGDEVILTNAVQLGGHVRVGFGAVFGGGVLVHQFCRVGELAFVSGMSGVNKDVPPYVRVFGHKARIFGLNLVGLKRRGLAADTLKVLKQALNIYLKQGTLAEAIEEIEKKLPSLPEVQTFVSFLKGPSKRGLIRKSGEAGW